MKAGRDLDKLIAEKVMRLDVSKLQDSGFSCQLCGSDDYDWARANPISQIPPYSTNIEAAWGVVGKLRLAIAPNEDDDGWVCATDVFYLDTNRAVTSQTAPLAICLAALKAVGYTGE